MAEASDQIVEPPPLIIETRERLRILTLNRPGRMNALTPELHHQLRCAVMDAAEEETISAVVLTGSGKGFCAGGDIKAASQRAKTSKETVEDRQETLRHHAQTTTLLHQMPKVTIALVNGAAAGAGLSLALACDLRIALDTAKMTTAFAKVGLSGDYGISYFLPYLVGQAKARELLFTAPVITGQQAHEYGLVNQVADAAGYEALVSATAAQLASMPTVALGYMKGNLNAAYTGTLSQALDREAAGMARCFTTEDHKNAAQAFVEKRAPEFQGR